ncbi:MAG TPA: diguanylate cyclase [Terriglobales bacterium]|nr:diguanylate cyclase [Terriglobales bacterium]
MKFCSGRFLSSRSAMQEQAIRDALTGLYNRRHLEEMLNHEVRRAERQGRPLSVLMLDLDHFKQLNDGFGHDAGDAVLRTVGAYLRSCVRSADVACRFGGEEFVVLMPEAQLGDAARRAQEICNGVRYLQIDHQGRNLGPVTVSIGVTSLSAELAEDATTAGSRFRSLPRQACGTELRGHERRRKVGASHNGACSRDRARLVCRRVRYAATGTPAPKPSTHLVRNRRSPKK